MSNILFIVLYIFTKTVFYMVVDYSYSLHISINNRGAYKAHSPLFEVFWNHIRKIGSCGNITELSRMIDNRSISYKVPKIARKTSKFFLNLEKCKCIFSYGINLESITNHARILEYFLELLVCKLRAFFYVKVIKSCCIVISFFENRFPAESCLSSF